MNRRCSTPLCLTFVVLCLGATLRAEKVTDIQPTGYVMDLAGVLQPQNKAKLEAMCTELEQKTGSQLAIVTVKSLDGNDPAEYANQLFKHLGVGAKKQDSGVLLMVAPNDRKYYTEVGYGLEPVITDARAGDAGRLMVPHFRQGDYNAGITAAAWQLAKYIADEKGVTLTGMPQLRPEPQHDNGGGLWVWIILGIILFVILASRNRSNMGPRGGGGLGSGWWVGPVIGSTMGRRGGWGGSSGGWSSGGGWGGGGGFGGFGGGASGGGGAGGSW